MSKVYFVLNSKNSTDCITLDRIRVLCVRPNNSQQGTFIAVLEVLYGGLAAIFEATGFWSGDASCLLLPTRVDVEVDVLTVAVGPNYADLYKDLAERYPSLRQPLTQSTEVQPISWSAFTGTESPEKKDLSGAVKVVDKLISDHFADKSAGLQEHQLNLMFNSVPLGGPIPVSFLTTPTLEEFFNLQFFQRKEAKEAKVKEFQQPTAEAPTTPVVNQPPVVQPGVKHGLKHVCYVTETTTGICEINLDNVKVSFIDNEYQFGYKFYYPELQESTIFLFNKSEDITDGSCQHDTFVKTTIVYLDHGRDTIDTKEGFSKVQWWIAEHSFNHLIEKFEFIKHADCPSAYKVLSPDVGVYFDQEHYVVKLHLLDPSGIVETYRTVETGLTIDDVLSKPHTFVLEKSDNFTYLFKFTLKQLYARACPSHITQL